MKEAKFTELLGNKVNLCTCDIEFGIILSYINCIHRVEVVNGYFALFNRYDKLTNISDSLETVIEWNADYVLDFGIEGLESYITHHYLNENLDRATTKTFDEILDEYRLIYAMYGLPLTKYISEIVDKVETKNWSKKHKNTWYNFKCNASDRNSDGDCRTFDKIKSSLKKHYPEYYKELKLLTDNFMRAFTKNI